MTRILLGSTSTALASMAAFQALCAFFGSSTASAAPRTALVVSAAASLKPALGEVETAYEKENQSVDLLVNYGASGALQKQIENGADVDVFVSASAEQMDALERMGHLLGGFRRDVLSNTLVLVIPKEAAFPLSFADLGNAKVKRVAIGEPRSVPAGAYAREALAKLSGGTTLDSKFVLAANVRQVLAYVESGEVDAGLVYVTDAKDSAKVKIIAKAPEGSHAPIVYPVGILKRTKEKAQAQAFLAYLRTPEARAIFERRGFGVLGEVGKEARKRTEMR